MKDDIRRAFDGLTEEPHPALRSSLRARLARGPVRPRAVGWTVAAAVAVVAIVALAGYAGLQALLVSNRGGGPGPSGSAGVPSPAASPSASPSFAASPSPGPSATAAVYSCGDLSGGTQGATADVTAVRVGTAAGYDRFVIEFSGPVPAFTVTRQGNPDFTGDASGQQFTLQGAGGVRVVVRGASAMSQGWPSDFQPGYPELREARQTGAFEGVFSWGLGVAAPDGGCLRTMVLTGPDRLVLDFQQP
jgi:hypothetical protein